MKAVVIGRPGGHSCLQIVEKNSPKITKEGQVRVSVSFVGVNYADCLVRLGLYAPVKQYASYPITPGFEFAGVVAEVAPDVTSFKQGDRVLGVVRFGAYQSELVINHKYLLHVPDSIDLAIAASLPAAYLTAHHILYTSTSLKKGERLLVRSIAGGVGSWLAQIGMQIGAEVWGTVSTQKKKDALAVLGINNIFIKEPKGTFDVITNAYGGSTIKSDLLCLRPEGRLAVYGFHGMVRTTKYGRLSVLSYMQLAWGLVRIPWIHPFTLVTRNASVAGCNLLHLFNRVEQNREALSKLLMQIEKGDVHVPPVTKIAFAEVSNAHSMLESGKTIGKLVLEIQ